LLDRASLVTSLEAFGVFCLLSSAVYLVNDVRDRDADRVHPIKSKRPVASGALGVGTAITAAAVLAGTALVVAATINAPFATVAAAYLGLMWWYSWSIKHVVILDVLALAGGFVLRAAGGAVAVAVTFSHWLLLLTLLLALFLALSKRRAELVALSDDARAHRKSLGEYSPYLLDQMIGVVTASTLLAYAFYTISPETVAKFGTDRLLWTVPFPLYGIFRYLYLMHQREGGGSPSDTLLEDRPILICVGLWGASVIAILYGPWR
jgi:4-hydroxybenzoate polyprenyltransferase